MTPFDEDRAVIGLCGTEFTLDRRHHIEVTDAKLLEAAGLTRTVPDYLRIRKLLLNGVEVPGARLAGTEYILRSKEKS